MTDIPQPPSDRALVAATRAGSDVAWSELRSRHSSAVTAMAASGTPPFSPQSLDAAFDHLRADLVAGADLVGDGQPAVRGVRAMAIAAVTGGTFGPEVPSREAITDAAGAIGREQVSLAAAFARLPEAWQVVLWHRWVELAPAAEVATILGRTPADVVALEQTADRGLFDAWNAVVLESDPPPPPMCRPVVALLGGYRRGTLPTAQHRAVETHLHGSGGVVDDANDAGCERCRQRLEMSRQLAVLVPAAIVPGLTGLTVAAYRKATGAGAAALGSAALLRRRSERTGRMAKVGAVAGVVLALLAAAVWIRSPFGDLDSTLADFFDRSAPTTTTAPSSSSSDTSAPSGTGDSEDELASRIELLFPDAPQSAVYVPGGRALDLTIALSAPAPVYADGTGTIDIGLTNNDEEVASATYLVRTSDGIVFEALTDGVGSCRPEDDDGATCTVEIAPGARASMSLRFAVDPGGPDRLVVDPSISPRSLELPVVTVPGLVVGEVVRGNVTTIGNSLGVCAVSTECREGVRNASSAQLALPAGAEIERALLVWEGDSNGPTSTVGLIGPTTGTARPVDAIDTSAEGLTGVVGANLRSTADVTDVVRENGGGRYTVVRPPGTGDGGDGTWTMFVVSRQWDSARRLAVVVRPVTPVTSDAPWALELPVNGSAEIDPTNPALRPLRVMLHARADAANTSVQRMSVDGADLGGDDPYGRSREDAAASNAVSYDREIASTEDALSFSASTTAGTVRLAAVGVALDILP